jgi:hypothetical protein
MIIPNHDLVVLQSAYYGLIILSYSIYFALTLFGGYRGLRPPPTIARILHRKSISTIPIPPLEKSIYKLYSFEKKVLYFSSL